MPKRDDPLRHRQFTGEPNQDRGRFHEGTSEDKDRAMRLAARTSDFTLTGDEVPVFDGKDERVHFVSPAQREAMIEGRSGPPKDAKTIRATGGFIRPYRAAWTRSQQDQLDLKDVRPSVRNFADEVETYLDQNGAPPTADELRRMMRRAKGDKPFNPQESMEALAVISQRFPSVSRLELGKALPSAGLDRIARSGGEEGVRSRYGGAYTPAQEELAEELGVDLTSNKAASLHELRKAERAAAEGGNDQRQLREVRRKTNGRSIESLDDLATAGVGIGDGAVRSLRDAGIQLSDLRAGRVGYDKLNSLNGWSEGKIRALEELGFVISPSTRLKRPVGRPPTKSIFGRGIDAFSPENQRAGLFTSRRQLVRDTKGDLRERVVKSRASETIAAFKERFRETVARPFAYVAQYGNSQARTAVRDANRLAELKRAQIYQARVSRARTGFGINLARFEFIGSRALMWVLTLGLSLAVVLLFTPVGFLQYAAWLLSGVAMFVLNAGYNVGLAVVNLVTSGGLNFLDVMGYVTSNILQGFLAQLPKYIPVFGSTRITGYAPLPLGPMHVTPLLDPNLLFPDCVDSNTLGSILLAALNSGLVSFGGWISANGPLAVGIAIIVLLGVPTYFLSEGASVGFLALGAFVALFPWSGGISLPVWGTVVLVAVLAGAIVVVWTRMQFSGVIAGTLAIGVGIVGLLSVLMLRDFVNAHNLNLARTLHVDVTPIASMLGGAFMDAGNGAAWLSRVLTTGWAHVLDPSNFQDLRSSFNFNNPIQTASAAKQCGGP